MGIDDKVSDCKENPILPGKEWYDKPCDACGNVIKEDGMNARDKKGKRLNYHSSCFSKYFTNKNKSEDRGSK